MHKKLLSALLCVLLAGTTALSIAQPVAKVKAAGGDSSDQSSTYQTYDGHTPTNAERVAAGQAAEIARAQAKANGVISPALVPTPGGTPDYFGVWGNFANSPLPAIDVSGNVISGTGMRKFVDGLPGLGPTNANNLGQYISVATPDTITYPGTDYYEIAAVEFTEKMSSDLPPTTLRGYVQLNNGTAAGVNSVVPSPVEYDGPTIIATSNRPVRIKFTNMLPTTTSGMDLFLPNDATIMGSGTGPLGGTETYTDNRAEIHLHGGLTPWVSDGTPYQWITPNLQTTSYPTGASVQDVPDMPVSPGGSVTLYYTNAQSARLMFYHDHADGETRLNVYDGLAAGYILQDAVETALISGGAGVGAYGTVTVPAGGVIPATEIPLIIQDKTFVPDTTTSYTNANGTFASQLAAQDPTWDTTKWGGTGSLWEPHVYMPNQNPFSPAGVTNMGRWDYGPWFGIPGILNGPVANPYYVAGGSEPPQSPGVPDVSVVGETFFDTPIVNGTAYPTLTVQPQAYRFRILSAGDDRGFNLSLFEAAPLTIGVTKAGTGYTSPPTVNITGGSVSGVTAAAQLGVVSIAVTAGGTGYTTPPTVTIVGTGTLAQAAAIMTGTSVSSILVLNQGAGYTSVPTVKITGGNGTGATATAALGVTRVDIVNRGTASSGAIVNPTITLTGGGGTGAVAEGSVLTDVSMVPAVQNSAIPFPIDWTMPTDGPNVFESDILDGRAGGVPDPRYMGPDWIQIGNEGGLLPQVAVIPPSPIGYQHNNKNATWNNITKKSLLLDPAERADVIVDFSAFAGKTLIMYNDAPAPIPMFDVRNDYYTGDPDQTPYGGAPTTLAGYGPDTRTVMQIRVAAATPVVFNLAALETTIPQAYAASQDRPIVPESVYNTALGTTYSDDYVRILDTEFSPAASAQGVSAVVVSNKGIGYLTAVPTVLLSGGGGTGATAAATIASQGSIVGFVVGAGGSGYTSAPTVTLSGGGGTGATARAIISSGAITRVDVITGGSGYTAPPNVILTGGGGTGAQIAATKGSAFTITAAGTGYNAATTTVTLSAPPAGGTQATATASLGIGSVTLVSTGTYPSYTTPPIITVTGGGGSGAVLVAAMAANPIPGTLGGGSTVASVTIVDGGGGYTSAPTITFSGGGVGAVQATATAVLGVGDINVSSAGSGYLVPPTVTITDTAVTPAVPGTGATAIAINNTLTTGILGDILVASAGTGYTTAPQVTFVGGGGAANTAVAYATLTNTLTFDLVTKDVVPGFERYYGRLSMQLGANLTPLYYDDPPSEVWQDSITAASPVAGDGTQIWIINPGLGVDTHPLHWHLFNLEVINRIGTDGVIRPPDPNEQGWRETVRINPFELLVVAARPISPKTNFGLPDSIRPLSPTEPIGSTMGFSNVLPGGGVTSVTNQLFNFGYEYVWHCHILSHEENDMMRPVSFIVNTTIPAVPVLAVTTVGGNHLSWNDATPATAPNLGNAANEVGFQVLRATGATGGTFAVIAKIPANTVTYIDASAVSGTQYRYQVNAYNNKGTSASSNTILVTTAATVALPAVPALTAPAAAAVVSKVAPISFSWGAVTGATSYTLQILSGATVVVNMPGLIAPNINVQNSVVLPAGAYTWQVSSTGPKGTSAFSAPRAFSIAAATAATTLVTPVTGSKASASAPIVLTWAAVAGATSYTVTVTPSLGGPALGAGAGGNRANRNLYDSGRNVSPRNDLQLDRECYWSRRHFCSSRGIYLHYS
jgi:FtsP/CotA-like multicopper oxidase with cupredoxin domain